MLANVINGIAFGSLLFILASGFSLALGVLRVINIAHGAFYILSVYLGVTIARVAGGFLSALVVDSLAIMVLAALLHRLLLRRFHLAPLPQVLATYGVTLIIAQSVRLIWGGYTEVMDTPSATRRDLAPVRDDRAGLPALSDWRGDRPRGHSVALDRKDGVGRAGARFR